MKTFNFKALILKHEDMDACYIEFPYSVEEEFNTKAQVKVMALFDGESYRGSLVKMGTQCYIIGIPKAIRRCIKKDAGDYVQVELHKDDLPRSVNLAHDIQIALQNDNLLQKFDAMSYSHQKEYVQWIEEAKKETTRLSRITKLCEKLRD